MDNSILPSEIEELPFGKSFNESMEKVVLPSSLKHIRFGQDFDQAQKARRRSPARKHITQKAWTLHITQKESDQSKLPGASMQQEDEHWPVKQAVGDKGPMEGFDIGEVYTERVPIQRLPRRCGMAQRMPLEKEESVFSRESTLYESVTVSLCDMLDHIGAASCQEGASCTCRAPQDTGCVWVNEEQYVPCKQVHWEAVVDAPWAEEEYGSPRLGDSCLADVEAIKDCRNATQSVSPGKSRSRGGG